MDKSIQKTDLTRRNLLTLGTSLLGATLLGTTSPIARAKAPFLGVYSPTFFRFKLGEFEITTISDGEAEIKAIHPIFGGNTTKEEVNKVLKSNLLPENLFNPFLHQRLSIQAKKSYCLTLVMAMMGLQNARLQAS